jgi:hypothetical protein
VLSERAPPSILQHRIFLEHFFGELLRLGDLFSRHIFGEKAFVIFGIREAV